MKNAPFSGRADSSNNTMAVLTQLQQCRNVEVFNPAIKRKELPQGVVLLTTYPIPDKDTADAGKFLDTLRSQSVEIIGPEDFVELIREHLSDMYSELAFPGHAVAARLAQYLERHQEHSAFALSEARPLREFFVNLTLSPSCSVLSHISRHGTEEITSCFRSYMEVPSATFANVASAQQVLPHPITAPPLIPLEADKVDESNETASARKRRRGPIDHLALADCYLSPREVVVKQPNLRKFVNSVQCHFTHLLESEDFQAIGDAIDLTVQCNEVLDHLTTLGRVTNLRRDADSDATAVNTLAKISSGEVVTVSDVDGLDANVAYDFDAYEIDPLSLASLQYDLCVQGEAGSGKTTLAKMLALRAIAEGDKVLYFPCSRLLSNARSLKSGIIQFLADLVGDGGKDAAEAYFREARLLIIDGIDEAVAFRRDIGSSLLRLVFQASSLRVASSDRPIIPDDCASSIKASARLFEDGAESSSDKDSSRKQWILSLREPVSRNKQLRVTYLNKGTAFQSAFEQLFEEAGLAKRLVVTVRSSSRVVAPSNFTKVQLRPLSDGQLTAFFQRWFSARKGIAKEIISFLEGNPRLKSVCRIPIVATIVAALHENGQNLPRSKTEVYEKRFALLFADWDRVKGVKRVNIVPQNDKRRYLAQVAFSLHRQGQPTCSRRSLQQLWEASFGSVYAGLDFEDVIEELVTVNSVLLDEGGGVYSLGHLSYQEYLAALGVMYQQKSHFLAERAYDPWWREVVLFYVGLTGDASHILEPLIANSGLPADTKFINELRQEGTFTDRVLMDFLREFDMDDEYRDDVSDWDEEEE